MLRGHVRMAVIKALGFGDHQKDLLGDYACVTQATVFTEHNVADMLGRVESANITRDETVLIGCGGDSTKRMQGVTDNDRIKILSQKAVVIAARTDRQ